MTSARHSQRHRQSQTAVGLSWAGKSHSVGSGSFSFSFLSSDKLLGKCCLQTHTDFKTTIPVGDQPRVREGSICNSGQTQGHQIIRYEYHTEALKDELVKKSRAKLARILDCFPGSGGWDVRSPREARGTGPAGDPVCVHGSSGCCRHLCGRLPAPGVQAPRDSQL